MSDMFDGDEFDYISSHKKRLAQEEAKRKEEERLGCIIFKNDSGFFP